MSRQDYQRFEDEKPKSGGFSAWVSGLFSKKDTGTSALDELAGRLPASKTSKKSSAADGAEESLLPKGPK